MTEAYETWSWRELPILRFLLLETDAGRSVEIEQVVEATGLERKLVYETLRRLRDSGYADVYLAGAFSATVTDVTERTRRDLGSWPSPESLVEQLARAFADAAERETEPERKTKLRAAADGLAGAGRAVAIDLFTAWLRQQGHLP